ncbi:DapH/DapD/GlmU-related protein [Clostridium vincentii]|uniref:DapH/DapD/GlmU-related protein n=1 Tax=Clostridium vincentii TaxID=52704 RepID=UPI000D02F9C5|nr:DapH/DapD/GlmU-related protein [Clostridium vincentii]
MSNIVLADGPYVDENSKLINTNLGKYTEISQGCTLENVFMGDYSYCCEYCILQNVTVGKFANIAAMTRIGATQHPIERASLHHFTYRRKKYGFDSQEDVEFFKAREENQVILGNDVWIGHGVTIMPGVKIGDGAVIGSGSVVTKDIEAYSVVAGVPTKKIKDRFPERIATKLQEIKWWDWTHEKIKENLKDFLINIDEFIEKHYESR